MAYFLRLEPTEDSNLFFVRTAFNDIPQNARFKKPDMPATDLFDPPDESGTCYKPYYNKTTGAVEWVVTEAYEVPEE